MLINQPFMEMLELRYIGVVLVFYQFLKEFVIKACIGIDEIV